MKGHQRAVEILKTTSVEYIHKRIEDGQTVEYKETYDYEDFCWNIYPYAFQCIRVTPLDCFQQVMKKERKTVKSMTSVFLSTCVRALGTYLCHLLVL